MWQGHRDGGAVCSVVDLLIGHPEMINFATSFWAGFASPPPQAPSYHPWSHSTDTQVDAGPSSRLRLRTFAMEVLPEPKPGNCIPFHPSLLKKTGPAIASDQCREAEAPPSKAGYESRGRKG